MLLKTYSEEKDNYQLARLYTENNTDANDLVEDSSKSITTLKGADFNPHITLLGRCQNF